MAFSAVAVVLGLCVLYLVVSAPARIFGAVERARLERFAARQGLAVTADNGNAVIRYLATTRRWRGGLLCLALLGFLWMPVATRHGVTVNLLAAFGGWFVGAVVAEWRVDGLARGPRAAALLRVRRLTDYVGRRVACLALVVWSVAAALGVAAVVVGLGRSAGRSAAVATLLTGAVVATVIAGVTRRILERPQPLVSTDVLEADNAIRGRSLNVMLGCALAIGGYLVTVSIDQIVTRDDSASEGVAKLIGFLVLPALGIVVARRPRPTAGPSHSRRADG